MHFFFASLHFHAAFFYAITKNLQEKYVDGNLATVNVKRTELFYYIIHFLVHLKRPEFGTFKGDLY